MDISLFRQSAIFILTHVISSLVRPCSKSLLTADCACPQCYSVAGGRIFADKDQKLRAQLLKHN